MNKPTVGELIQQYANNDAWVLIEHSDGLKCANDDEPLPDLIVSAAYAREFGYAIPLCVVRLGNIVINRAALEKLMDAVIDAHDKDGNCDAALEITPLLAEYGYGTTE